MKNAHPITQKATYALSLLKSAVFLSENLSLPFVELIATGRFRPAEKDFKQNLSSVIYELNKILTLDAQLVADGIYPLTLPQITPWQHTKSLTKILLDSYEISKRRAEKVTKKFSAKAKKNLKETPNWYQRNYHFQTDGYGSEESARLYEHQVDVLFAGAADPMRRLILRPLSEHLKNNNFPKNGKGFHLLEIGAGVGSLTRSLLLAFPEMKITVLEISPAYLKLTKKNLAQFKQIKFLKADATNIPFPGETFHGAVSCFLFHEMPLEVRKAVMQESLRILHPGGFIGAVDSIQQGENPSLEWALKRFPVDFHEPFYKNYQQHKLENIFQSAGAINIATHSGFFSKAVFGEKISARRA